MVMMTTVTEGDAQGFNNAIMCAFVKHQLCVQEGETEIGKIW